MKIGDVVITNGNTETVYEIIDIDNRGHFKLKEYSMGFIYQWYEPDQFYLASSERISKAIVNRMFKSEKYESN